MSDSNRVAVGIVAESTFGTTPATPAFTALRLTRPGLSYTPRTVVSDEARADRQVTDLVLVGAEAAGDLGFELSYGSLDTMIEAAMCSTWVNKPIIVNTVADTEIGQVTDSSDTFTVASGGTAFKAGMLARTTGFTNAGNNLIFRVGSSTGTTIVGPSLSLTDEAAPPLGAQIQAIGFQGASGDIEAKTVGGNQLFSTVLDFTTLGIVAGEWLKVGGTASGDKFAGTAANNDWVRVQSVADHVILLDVVPSGWTADDGSGKTIKVFWGDYIRNGTTKKSYTIERRYLDHSPVDYEYFRGMTFDSIAFEIGTQAIIRGTARLMGKDQTADTSRFSGATDVPAATNSVYNSSSNVGRLGEGGSAVDGPNYVLNASITFANNVRAQPAVGFIGATGVGLGEVTTTGQLSTYFGNLTLANKVINNTASSYDIRFTRADESGHTILIDLPRTKYSNGAVNVPGKNSDVTLPLQFQAIMHPTLGYTNHIQRFAYTE